MEKNIHKFIIHVVNNLFPLYEYSEGEIKKLMDKFKEEADDLNIQITDTELKKYIERFDQLKNSPKVEDKNLRNWPLPKLIKLVTSSEGAEVEEETGPDVIYSGNGITVYSGGSEELCQRHRSDVPWCITRGSFGNYRFSEGRRFPSFYLIKNDSPEYINDRKLAFVAIQVRDTTDESKKYIWTPKDNSPNESKEMSWSELTSDIPWLDSIPGIKGMLKYVPLSATEKATNIFSKTAISIRQWVSLPFAAKKQYLVVRKEKSDLFNDISKDEFVANYLPKYPQLASFIAVTPGLLDSTLLLKHLDKFNANDRKSIVANLRTYVDTSELTKDNIPFDVKKLLVTLRKWQLDPNERMYITKNGEAIIKLKFTSGDVQVGVFTAEDDYPNIKLNARTSKYLLDYPDIDKIPFNTLIKLTNDNIVDKSFIESVIVKAEEDPNSSIVVKDVEDGKILLDSNSFTSYKIKDGKISSIPFDSEEVQNVLSSETENTGFQESAVNLVFQEKNLPSDIDKNSFINILNNTPYSQRFGTARSTNAVILVNPQAEVGSGNKPIFTIPQSINNLPNSSLTDYGRVGEWTRYDYSNSLGLQDWAKIIQYYKDTNQKFTDNKLKELLNSRRDHRFAKAIVQMNLPMAEGSILRPAVVGDNVLLVNATDPRASFIVSDRSGKVLNKVLTSAQARQILGGATPTTQTPTPPTAVGAGERIPAPIDGTPRRGRPAGIAGAPRAAAAPVVGGTPTSELMAARGLSTTWNALPASVRNRLASAVQENGISRGASRRNNQLGNRGRVISTWNAGPSSIYFIRLANDTIIASINIQPGNSNYLLAPGREPIGLNSPTELLSALQARDLAEVLIAEFMTSNPTKLTETKKILNYYIKSKNRKK